MGYKGEIKVKYMKGKLAIFTPYNYDFLCAIKEIKGAKWNSNLQCWLVGKSNFNKVREMIKEIYDKDIDLNIKTQVKFRFLDNTLFDEDIDEKYFALWGQPIFHKETLQLYDNVSIDGTLEIRIDDKGVKKVLVEKNSSIKIELPKSIAKEIFPINLIEYNNKNNNYYKVSLDK